MKRGQSAVRFASRLLVGAFTVGVFTLVSIQFARIFNENIAMSRSLSTVQHDVSALRVRKQQDERELRRLLSPDGAVPEIHDRLHLVRANEAIIYVKPAPASHP